MKNFNQPLDSFSYMDFFLINWGGGNHNFYGRHINAISISIQKKKT